MKLLTESLVSLDVDVSNRWEVIKLLCSKMNGENLVKDSFLNSVIEREKEAPTGLPTEIGVAIPHTTGDHVLKTSIAVAQLKNPVNFQSMEDPEKEIAVELVFLLAIADPSNQILLLRSLINIFRSKENLLKMKNARSKKDIVVLLDAVGKDLEE